MYLQLKNSYYCKINNDTGYGENSAVEAVEQPAVSGKHVARILNHHLAFDARLNKVAQCARYHYHNRHSNPLPQAHCLKEVCHNCAGTNSNSYAAKESFPGLFWLYALKHLVAAKQAAYAVCTTVVAPNEDEN